MRWLGNALRDFQVKDMSAQPLRLLGAFGVVCYAYRRARAERRCATCAFL